MYSEIRTLIIDDHMYLITNESVDRDDRCGLCCLPHLVGDTFIAFANADLSILPSPEKLRAAVDLCFNDSESIYSIPQLQTILLTLKQALDDIQGTDGYFAKEISALEEADNILVNSCPAKEIVAPQMDQLLFYLSSLQDFQTYLRDVLVWLSMAGKKESSRASSAHLLEHIFHHHPQFLNLARCTHGYMLTTFSPDGTLRSEMMDLSNANLLRSILTPEEKPLLRNDINDIKKIGRYLVFSNVKSLISIDLIEGIIRSRHFSKCDVCGKFFFTDDMRKSYCDNPACCTSTSRTKKRKNKINQDPYLSEAFRIQRAVHARYQRSDLFGSVRKNLPYDTYEDWYKIFKAALNEYEQTKACALLLDNYNEIVSAAGEKLLAIIRPSDYTGRYSPDKILEK